MSIIDTDSARAWRIQLAHLRQELLSPVNALLGYAEIMHEEASRKGRPDILPDMSRILGAARDLAGKVDRLVDGDRAKRPPGPAAATQEQELRHDLRTPLNAIKGYAEMLREDVANFSSDSLGTDLDRLLVAATDLLLRLDRIVRFSVDVQETSLASNETGAVIVSDLMRSLGPVRHEPYAVTETGSILVVDDIAANRDLLSRRLTRDGHRVASVAGGQQALQALADNEFDLVLLDLMMPDINGFDVLVRMKADERLRRIPVIMITALAETESAVRCIEAGAEDYLPKPFDPILLRARINACLHKKRWRDREQKYLRRIEDETAKFERLLLTILPKQVIGRLNQGEAMIADRFEGVSVLFADLVGFTERREDQDHRRCLHGRRRPARSEPRSVRSDRENGARHDRSARPRQWPFRLALANPDRHTFRSRGCRHHRHEPVHLRRVGRYCKCRQPARGLFSAQSNPCFAGHSPPPRRDLRAGATRQR
jgi:adenylate cyclase